MRGLIWLSGLAGSVMPFKCKNLFSFTSQQIQLFLVKHSPLFCYTLVGQLLKGKNLVLKSIHQSVSPCFFLFWQVIMHILSLGQEFYLQNQNIKVLVKYEGKKSIQ